MIDNQTALSSVLCWLCQDLILVGTLIYLVFYILWMLSYSFFDFQEIKFDPHVMCESVDKKCTFRASQVYAINYIYIYTVNLIVFFCLYFDRFVVFVCSLKMETSFAFKNLLQLKVVSSYAMQMFPHLWIMFTIAKYAPLQLFINVLFDNC